MFWKCKGRAIYIGKRENESGPEPNTGNMSVD